MATKLFKNFRDNVESFDFSGHCLEYKSRGQIYKDFMNLSVPQTIPLALAGRFIPLSHRKKFNIPLMKEGRCNLKVRFH